MERPGWRPVLTLLAVPAGVVAVLVFVIAALVGLNLWLSAAVAVVLALVAAVTIHLSAETIVLRALEAEPLDDQSAPRLTNLVEGLCVANGFHRPSLYTVDDLAPNAAAVGRTPDRGAIIVTTGFREELTRIEMEGVLAQLLARIEAGHTVVAVDTAVVAGMLLRPLGGVGPSLARRVNGHTTAVHADLAGVEITRYPPGLRRALVHMSEATDGLRSDNNATNHLWVVPTDDALVASSYTLDDRIALLQEL